MPDRGQLTISSKPIRIDSDPELEPGDYVQLSVADTGVGMTPDVVTRSNPDVLILAFAMPGMNGAEFGKAVRTRYPKLPIVFVTGYADVSAIEAAVGPNTIILRKPFRAADLQTALGEAVSRAG
jgi:CheY-like chemotaxis protein